MQKGLVHFAVILMFVLACRLLAEEKFPHGNILYDRPQEYAKVTEQTSLSEPQAEHIRALFRSGPNDIQKIARIFQWVGQNFEQYRGGGRMVGELSAEQLLESRRLSGCNDRGILLTCLLRHAGYPVVFLNAAGIEWAEDFRHKEVRRALGHVFLEVYVDGKWIVIDSTTGEYINDYDFNNPVIPIPKKNGGQSGFVVYQKGKDLWDLGVRSIRANIKAMTEFARTYPLETIVLPSVEIKKLNTGCPSE